MYVMKPRSYRPWATRITCDDDRRSLRPPSCCNVEVMNGAFGPLRYGLVSTDATVNGLGSRGVVNERARTSSRTTTFLATTPSWPKSRPLATLRPPTETIVAP